MTIRFLGDYANGDFTQWVGAQSATTGFPQSQMGNTSASVVNAPNGLPYRPPRRLQKAGLFIAIGDSGTGSANDRSEVLSTAVQADITDGNDWWYGWWTYIPSSGNTGWLPDIDWNVITQFNDGNYHNPTPVIGVDGSVSPPQFYFTTLQLPGIQQIASGKQKTLFGPVIYDQWIAFRMFAQWRTNNTGNVYLWMNGKLVASHLAIPTVMSFAAGPYWKQGIYRNHAGTGVCDNTIYHTAAMRTDTRDEIEAYSNGRLRSSPLVIPYS